MNAKTFHYFRLSKISDVFMVYVTILSVDVPGKRQNFDSFQLVFTVTTQF